MKSYINNLRLLLKFTLLLLYSILTNETKTNSDVDNRFDACNADLEKKFMIDNIRCPNSGRFPVKGSCTAFILCISFGGHLMKPSKHIECSSGTTFDLEYLRCTPVQILDGCLQRKCYPAEAFIEDEKPLKPSLVQASEEEEPKTVSVNTKGENQVDEIITTDIQNLENITNTEGFDRTTRNSTCLTISSASTNGWNAKLEMIFLVLKLAPYFLIR